MTNYHKCYIYKYLVNIWRQLAHHTCLNHYDRMFCDKTIQPKSPVDILKGVILYRRVDKLHIDGQTGVLCRYYPAFRQTLWHSHLSLGNALFSCEADVRSPIFKFCMLSMIAFIPIPETPSGIQNCLLTRMALCITKGYCFTEVCVYQKIIWSIRLFLRKAPYLRRYC